MRHDVDDSNQDPASESTKFFLSHDKLGLLTESMGQRTVGDYQAYPIFWTRTNLVTFRAISGIVYNLTENMG
jgi:hypothetical protein